MVSADGCVKRDQPQNDDPLGRRQLMQQDHRHRRNLGHGVGLAEDARAKLPPTCNRVKDGGHKQDANIAPENQDGHRRRHQALVHQNQEQAC